MSARKFTMKEMVDRVLDSDFDPGKGTQESQDEGDTSAHESQDEADNSGDTNILARRENTDYVDQVIRKDAAVRVKAWRRGRFECDRHSDSSFDHSSEFEKDTLVVQMKPNSNVGFSFTGIETRKEVCEQESLLVKTCIAPIP